MGVGCVVKDQQNALGSLAQSLYRSGNSGLLLIIRAYPAKSNAERHKIGAQAEFRLCSNPPDDPVVVAMLLRIGRRKCRLADAAQPVQGGNATAPWPSSRLNAASIAASASSRPKKCVGTRIGMLEMG